MHLILIDRPRGAEKGGQGYGDNGGIVSMNEVGEYTKIEGGPCKKSTGGHVSREEEHVEDVRNVKINDPRCCSC